jgi:hypothetical protein
MDPQTEKEFVKSIDAIQTALEALHEVSVDTLTALKDIRSSLKSIDNNIGHMRRIS